MAKIENQINNIIARKEKPEQNIYFMPKDKFFNQTGIPKSRYNKIRENKVSETLHELQAVAKFFAIDINISLGTEDEEEIYTSPDKEEIKSSTLYNE